MEEILIVLFFVGIFFLFGGTGQKKKPDPPPVQPTERDKVVEEMIFTQYSGAIASMTPAGRTHLAEQIKQVPSREIK